MLREILDAITNTHPMLKIDASNCPTVDKLTDEMELYRNFDKNSEGISNFNCTPCDRKFKSADSAVMHYFHDHGHAFNNSFPLDLTKKSLKCSEWNCNYQTYAKHHYIAHLGIYHGKFKDSYYNISSQIQGLSSFQNVIFEKCKKVIQPIGPGQ